MLVSTAKLSIYCGAIAGICIALCGCQPHKAAIARPDYTALSHQVGWGGCNFANPVFDHAESGLVENQAVSISGGVLALIAAEHGVVNFWPDILGHPECFLPADNMPEAVADALLAAGEADESLRVVRIDGQGVWELYQDPRMLDSPRYWRLNITSASAVETVPIAREVLIRQWEIIKPR